MSSEDKKPQLNDVDLKQQRHKKNGIILAIFSVPTWYILYVTHISFAKIFNVPQKIDYIEFFSGPFFITITSLLIVLFEIPRRLKVNQFLFTGLFVFIHTFWSVYLYLMLPEVYNGYFILVNFTIGLLFIHISAGFLDTITLSICAFSVLIGSSTYMDTSVGTDEKLFYYIFWILSISMATVNGHAKKRRRQFYKIRKTVEKSNIDLKIADKQKTEFFQNVSHELRTPLSLIMTPLEEERKDRPENQNISIALKNSNRLYRLVNQLLDFQKVSTSKLKMDLIPIDIVSFLSSCTEYFKPICEKKNIRFKLNIETTNKIFVLAQVDALEKIIFNYLSNALKFTQDQGYIALILEESDGKAIITVKDSGIGISPENQKKLFNVFSQIDENSTREYEGTGLGLALVKELAHEMNGNIGVESEVDFGSAFWVELPVTKSAKDVIDLLVIDDEKAVLNLFEKLIVDNAPHLKYKVFSSTYDAIKLIETHTVKCVISDAVLQLEDGIEFLSQMHLFQPECHRILMTGHKDLENLDQAVSDGKIDELVYKPINPKEILDKINRAITESKITEKKTSTFEKFLPKSWQLSDSDEVPAEKTSDKDIAAIMDRSKTERSVVLIVDDIQDMRKVISQCIKDEKYDIVFAQDGLEALDILDKIIPDLVIADWMMPKMSGIELINKMKGNPKFSTVPTILLTAKSDEESKQIGNEIGASAYVGKPFNQLELLSIVKNLLRLKSKERKVESLNRDLSESILQRYLPPQIVNDIIQGNTQVDESAKMSYITILNVELSEFKSTHKDLGPAKTTEFLNEYLTQMSESIYKLDGIIEKFDADNIRIIFGAPTEASPATQVKNAFDCSEALNKKIELLNEKWGNKLSHKLTLKLGINHDLCLVGHFGSSYRSDYAAIGDPVKIAERIMEISVNGVPVFTKTVLDLIPDEFDYEGSEKITCNEHEVFVFKLKPSVVKKNAA